MYLGFTTFLLLLCVVWPTLGQDIVPSRLNYEGPPAPIGTATVARDEAGRVTVRALRLDSPLELDGRLDETMYAEFSPMSDFVQTEPRPDEPATEKTEVWVSFDEENVYVSVRAWESQPERMIVNEMRRDSNSILQNENFAFMFDTFYDRRNSLVFTFNPVGGRMDGQNTNEGQYNGDWNPVWRLATARFDGGWSAEAAIPFKSLRYRPERDQIWGFNARRGNRWKNEISYLARVPIGTGANGIHRVSFSATLVGLQTPTQWRTLDLKPYGVSNLTTDLAGTPRRRNDPGGDFGIDAKYTVTQSLTADFTYNTDFAQVEADEQQVNLTRFNLFFPEKREFFLENLGLFNFGGATANGDTPTLFYSRRIGLDAGSLVPLEAGGRLTGQVGALNIGLINIQSGGDDVRGVPGANFTVARLRRDVLRRSAIGLLYTRRSQMANGAGANETIGVDGRFAFFDNLAFNTYWAKTTTPGLSDYDTSHRLQMQYNGDRYGMTLNHVYVGDNFVPDVGFVRRDSIWRQYAQARFSPRPTRFRGVRKFNYQGQVTYITNDYGMLETRTQNLQFGADFQNSDEFEIEYEKGFEAFLNPFQIARGVTIPGGAYDLHTFKARWVFGQQRRAAGEWFVERGPFYNGTRTSWGHRSARVEVTSRLAVEPTISVNRVELPYGKFTATVISSRTTLTLAPLMFVSGLVQYSSGNNLLAANVRFRWEYLPGSELFVVFNEGRDTGPRGFPEMQNRSVVVKVNRLFRF